MKLVLKNIGLFKDLSISLNGLTVITGENDTGKSTIGKALFASCVCADLVEQSFWRDLSNTIVARTNDAAREFYSALYGRQGMYSDKYRDFRTSLRYLSRSFALESGGEVDNFLKEINDYRAWCW